MAIDDHAPHEMAICVMEHHAPRDDFVSHRLITGCRESATAIGGFGVRQAYVLPQRLKRGSPKLKRNP